MVDAAQTPWPVPVQALGATSVATVVFRHRAAFHLALIVKASYQWLQGGRCQLAQPEPIARSERAWEGEGSRSPEKVSDLAPFLPRAEVRVVGHAYGPPSVMVPASSVRLGVFRDVALVEKTIHVYGDRRTPREGPRPFQRMPLRYELAFGGPGTDNPAGVAAPNLVSPLDPQKPAAFAAISRGWPWRARRAPQLLGLDAPIYDLPDDFDFSFFQAAAEDQQVDALGGDEWLLLDGMHPSAPRLSSQLPGTRAEALVWAETGPSAGMRWSPPLALDTVIVDADKHRVDLIWRGSFTLPGGDAIVPDLRAAAGVEGGEPIVWPDVDAALLTRRKLARYKLPAEERGPEPEMERQETQAMMDVVASALPFGPAPDGASRASYASLPGLPWDPPSTAPHESAAPSRGTVSPPRQGDTPMPDENTPQPALPFSRLPVDALGSDLTFTSSGDDVDLTESGLESRSTAPPPPPEGAASVEVPKPPLVPVVVPPPAVGAGPLGGGLALGYEGRAHAAPPDFSAVSPPPFVPPPPPPLVVQASPQPSSPAPAPPPLMAPPPVPPARVSSPSISDGALERADTGVAPAIRDESSFTGTLVGAPNIDEVSFDSGSTQVRPPASFEAESTETTAPAGLAAAIAHPAMTPGSPLDANGVLRQRLAAGDDLSGEDFSRLDLSGVDFSGATLARASFGGAVLRGCNFTRAKLADAKLAGADLESANLTGADLTRADFTRARLRSAVLRDAQVTQANMIGSEAESADFAGAKGARVVLSRAKLRGASFVGADLPSVDFTGAALPFADLRGAQLADAILDDVQADGACFEESRLVRVRGHGANLERAQMARSLASGSGWDRATFDGADLSSADFSDATLLRASLHGAVFRDADLRGAKLANVVGDDVDLSGARLDGADLRQARLDGAKLDGATLVKVVATKVSLNRASLVRAELRSGNFRGAKLKGADLEGASLREADLRDADLEDARLDGTDRAGARMQGANLDGATGGEG